MLHYATEKDLGTLAELEMLLFPDNCLNEHSLEQEMGTSRAFLWGHSAYCIVRFGPELTDILRVGVRPEVQGRGIGRHMLTAVLELSYLPAMLTVNQGNTRARRLYSRLGFRTIGMLPHLNGLLMLRELTSEST